MKAVIELDVPEWQIGQNVSVYFPDTMLKRGKCELLKEHETVVKQWTKEIADNQLAHAPKDSHEFMSLNEHLENEYKRGIWDGLQIAWNIISEGR
jgi:hypothetical protein